MEPNPGIMAGSIVLALGAFALGWQVYMNRQISLEPWKSRFAAAIRVVSNKYYMDDAYQWGVDRAVLVFSRFIALFDRVVVNDIGVNTTGESFRRLGFKLRYHVSGRMYSYTLGMAVGAVVVAILLVGAFHQNVIPDIRGCLKTGCVPYRSFRTE